MILLSEIAGFVLPIFVFSFRRGGLSEFGGVGDDYRYGIPKTDHPPAVARFSRLKTSGSDRKSEGLKSPGVPDSTEPPESYRAKPFRLCSSKNRAAVPGTYNHNGHRPSVSACGRGDERVGGAVREPIG